MSGWEGAVGEAQEELSIQQASSALNVPAPTIRSWERRYGVPVADRSNGGHRRYTRGQLDRLRLMRDLIAQGRRPVDAAALVRAGHATSSGPLVDAFLDGARSMDPESITRALEEARAALGLDRTVDEVLLPAMREVGEWWHAGQIDVAHEHLATSATRAWLSTVVPAGPRRSNPPIILCCGPRDHHTLGLEAMDALLRYRRWDCRLLGARTPVESLGQAVQETNAAAVVMACHLPAGRTAAVEALVWAALRSTRLFYGGGAFATRQARRGVPGRYLGTNLGRAADLVTDTITEGR
ncbi:MAG TPA: B12-binding domain-containing protein [Propionibacteriaceae bacterium]|nr:B12-binding domain-containing protein [Propionibacteriaceae bacterium]